MVDCMRHSDSRTVIVSGFTNFGACKETINNLLL